MRRFSATKQTGLSLVEVMVALALSAVLVTALYRIVMGNQQSVNLTDSYARAQEAARTASNMMSFDLRMAGYRGCVNNSVNITNLLDTTSPDYDAFLHDFNDPVEAINDYDPATGVTFGGHQPVAGSDVFISRGAITTDLYVGVEPLAAASKIQIAGPASQLSKLIKGNILMVSDCEQAHVFAISNITGGSGNILSHDVTVPDGPDNTSLSFAYAYANGSQVLMMNSIVYFVAPSTLMPGVNALYRLSLLDDPDNAVELVPYVDNMQLTYGVDTDADTTPDTYMTSDQIASAGLDMFSSVYTVAVDLSIVTENDQLAAKPYRFTVYVRNAGDGS